eukprot:364232-Chlamydomonas_euryale.AAC.9
MSVAPGNIWPGDGFTQARRTGMHTPTDAQRAVGERPKIVPRPHLDHTKPLCDCTVSHKAPLQRAETAQDALRALADHSRSAKLW